MAKRHKPEEIVARNFHVANDRKVTVAPTILEACSVRHLYSTDLDALATVLGIDAKDIVSTFDLELFKSDLQSWRASGLLAITSTKKSALAARQMPEWGDRGHEMGQCLCGLVLRRDFRLRHTKH